MTTKKKRNIEDEELEVEITEEETADKEPKTISFFSRFKDFEDDYLITLYRKTDRNKRSIVKEYENYTPTATEIQETYGGGTFMLYASQTRNGKFLKLLDTCELHIEPPLNSTTQNTPVAGALPINNTNDFFSAENLQKLSLIKTIFSSGNNSSDITQLLLTMSDNNNTMIKEMMKAQQESERRTTDLILKVTENNKSNLTELMETYSFFNEISGKTEGTASAIDKIIDLAPALFSTGLIPQLQNNMVPKQPQATVNTKPIQKKSELEIIDSIIARIPDQIKNSITLENKDVYINKFYEQYSTDASKEDITKIIDRILEKKL